MGQLFRRAETDENYRRSHSLSRDQLEPSVKLHEHCFVPPGSTTIGLQFLLMHRYDTDPEAQIEKAHPQMAAHIWTRG